MIHIIDQKKITIQVLDEKIILPDYLNKSIIENFEKLKQSGLNIWNGEIVCVSKCEIDNESIKIICKKTNYAHYLYEEKIGCPQKYRCINVSAGCLFETLDGYYIIAELNDNTSYPNVLQVVGGTIDSKDILKGNANIMKTIIREVKEEINIDLLDNKKILSHKLKYMYVSEKHDRPGIKFFSKVKLNMNYKKVLEEFEKYNNILQKNKIEAEIKQLHFLKKEEAIKIISLMDNPKREYLIPLLENDLK